jgi:porphobilinogen synthase
MAGCGSEMATLPQRSICQDRRMTSPITLRRLRQDRHVRALTRGARPHLEQFIQPLFVVEGLQERESIPGLTGVYRDTPASLLAQIESDLRHGVCKFLLFGVPASHQSKDIDWSFTAGQIAAIKERFGKEVWLSVDVCL